MKTKKCKRCGKKFIPKKSHPRQKFHNKRCRLRYYSLKQYHKYKNDKGYKKKQKKYFNNWRRKNRKRFNDLCREKSKLYQRNIRKERRKLGLCLSCGRKRGSRWITCRRCRQMRRK